MPNEIDQPLHWDLTRDAYIELLEEPCSVCGQPCVVNPGSWLCFACNDDLGRYRTRPADSAAERLAILDALGLSRLDNGGLCFFPGERKGPEWKDWNVEAWTLRGVLDRMPGHPWIREVLPIAESAGPQTVLRYRVWHPDRPMWITMWWDPYQGTRRRLENFDPRRVQDTVDALGALCPAPRMGRPRRAMYSKQEFCKRLRSACDAVNRRNHKLTQSVVAGEMEMSEKTFRNHRKRYNISWPPDFITT